MIYVDSAVYLDLITMNTTVQKNSGELRWQQAKLVFDAVNADRARLASSALIEAEVCCNGEARASSTDVRELLSGWFTAPSTVWTDIDRFLARSAAELMDAHRGKGEPGKKMGSADGLHLAAAVRLGADYLMTQDGGYPIGHVISGVTVMRPAVVWQQTLWETAGSIES